MVEYVVGTDETSAEEYNCVKEQPSDMPHVAQWISEHNGRGIILIDELGLFTKHVKCV